MATLLPMSEMDSELKALRNKDRIILNVGGIRHETFKSTLRNFPDTRLAWITQRDNFTDYDPERNEYFFDRHPGVFQQIMNFYRTGKLHCPSDVCGPLFEEELNFWGIDEKQMEPCCWSTYTLHREAQENLKVFNGPDFDDDSETELEEWKSGEPSEQHRSSNTPAWQRWRSKIWSILDGDQSSKISKIYVWVSLVFVVVSVMSLCAYTDSNIIESDVGKTLIEVIDYVCGAWFTLEFLVRCTTCPNILQFSKQILNWIDFIAIIPFYINLAWGGTNTVSMILELGRMLRLLRFFNKMSLGFQILKHTIVASSKEMFLLLLLVMIPVLLFAGILYLCESSVHKTEFKSIPEAFWWAIITLTTVGYGDMVPKTTQGKLFGSICAGVSMFISALPISIIGANFSLYYRHAQAKLKLPKKPRKVLIGAANTLLRDEPNNEPENSERNSSDDLTTEVYLGPKRPRRERMSLFCNGMVTQRNSSRLRSLGGYNLPVQTNIDGDNSNVNSPDCHKSSLLSTSTKSTTVDSPPPRCVSFPANLPGRDGDRNIIFEPGGGGKENTAFRKDKEDTPRTSNGTRSFSAGSRYKRNGIIHPVNTPTVKITPEIASEKHLSQDTTNSVNNNESEHNLNVPLNERHEETDAQVTAANKPLTIAEG